MKKSGFTVMSRLIGLVKPLSGYMVLAVGLGVLGHLCATGITVLGGFGILQILGLSAPLTLGGVFALLAVAAVLRGLLRYGEQSCNHFIAFKLLALLRDRVFTALRRLCPAKLEGKDRGNLISLITSDIELLEVFYAHTISPICIAVLFCLGVGAFLGSYHILLGLYALMAYLLVGVVIPLATSRLSRDRGLRFRDQSGDLSAFVLDSLRGLPEIQQYGRGEARLQEMERRTAALSQVEKAMKAAAGGNAAVTGAVILLLDLGMLLLASQLLGFSGSLIATLTLMGSFGPVVALAALGATLQSTFAAGNRVLSLLEESPVVEEITGKPPVEFSGATAKNVTFSYENEEILRDFSLEIPQNTIVGITGRSGSGKSTLLKLFMRFWQTGSGQVAIGETSVEDINTKNLRNMESFVTQTTHLFRDTIANNLKIAKPDATEEERIAACKKASIHDFIMTLPKGYDTQVGELGDSLSGGERQRLGLARAFLHDAPFLLLDEPTSNLDSLNEGVILKSLHKSCRDKTLILVSHRKSTMGIARRIYSVENGRVS